VRSNWFPLAALAVASVLLAATGCQRGGGGTQPAADARGSGADQGPAGAESAATAAIKSDQDPLHPVVQIDTVLGTLKVRLDKEKAPITVDNFLDYVGGRFYDQTIFHQVRKEYPKLILAGGYTPELVEKKAHTPIRNEAHNGLKNRRGTIAMARQPDTVDSATCHFFINLSDNEILDYRERTPQGYRYCVFGEVIEGLDVVDRIGQAPVHDSDKFEQIPVETIAIKTIRQIK
jgi:cyclophilin family peptidyl-prolyl cis-trans isomerase